MSEVMPKAPDGYRELTGEEKESFLNVGTAITLMQFKLGQHQAELESARAHVELAQSRIRDAQREMQIALLQKDEQNERLKIIGAKEDLIVDGTRVYIIVRPEGWEPPKKQQPGRPELRVIPGVGRVEITKTPPVPAPAAPPAQPAPGKSE